MNNRAAQFAQAIRGPIVLITVGVLFALQQANIVGIHRSWPLILIVIGVIKLLERMYVPPSSAPIQPPQPPIGFGDRPQ